VRIAVARDAAFTFLYHDNLALLKTAGATILPFSPLSDAALPSDADMLYLIGGYPELHAPELAANAAMRAAIKAFCERGRGLVWAECGGLMLLAQNLIVRGADVATATEAAREAGAARAAEAVRGAASPQDGGGAELFVHPMCGVLPFDVSMTSRMAMGYCRAALRPAAAALLDLPVGTSLRCQQYHFSEATIEGEPAVAVDPRTGGGAGISTVGGPPPSTCGWRRRLHSLRLRAPCFTGRTLAT
jgi:Cobyrinic acid a,c-diamide synthase